jgi:predicted MPP superfamily phosphohydrolase
MTTLPDWLVLAAIPGHLSWLLWIGNILHAQPWNWRRIKKVAYVINLAIFGGSAAAGLWWLVGSNHLQNLPRWLQAYVGLCAINTVCGTLPWLVRRALQRDPAVLLSDVHTLVDVRRELTAPGDLSPYGRFMTSLPWNESLTIAMHEKQVCVPRLPAALDGLRIVHLTDVHMTGRIGRPFFDRIVELTNAADADLILLTGDLLESDACRAWIADTFGLLRSRHGAYFIFGNHDIRVDHRRTQRELEAAGLVYVGGGHEVLDVRGESVLLAGNERPWIDAAADPATFPDRATRPHVRILLSHSPDQYPWAKRHDFDLVLAGHVHGGQIQIPPLGPVLAPSRFGTRYACGVFHEGSTVMHVGRGLSSRLPLRYFCRPELTTLILKSPS